MTRGEGVHHWWVQRLTSVALIPLSIWFLVSLLALPAHDYTTVVTWLGQKWTAVLLAVLVAIAAWHSHLGVQVVLEDYAHGTSRRMMIVAAICITYAILAAGLFAVGRIAFAVVPLAL